MIRAAVFCGGFGSRLRAVIGERQKCAVDVGGRPWISRVLDRLECSGIEEAVLLTGYKVEEIDSVAAAWRGALNVRILHTTPSGPEAALDTFFARFPLERVLVINGDTLPVERTFLPAFVGAPKRRPYRVRGTALMAPAVEVDAGIWWRGSEDAELDFWPEKIRFLDIGSLEGLAEARRRFA